MNSARRALDWSARGWAFLLRPLCGAAVIGLGGCAEDYVRKADLNAVAARLEEKLTLQKQQFEREIERLLAALSCKEDAVRDFMRRCEAGSSNDCSPQAITEVLAFLDTQKYAALWVRPNEAFAMAMIRKGQLLDMADPIYLHRTTKFVILIQPRAETPAMLEEAQATGNQFVQYLRVQVGLPSHIPILGPHLVPCKFKAEMLKNIVNRADRYQRGEPGPNEPRLRAWILRTDCGGKL